MATNWLELGNELVEAIENEVDVNSTIENIIFQTNILKENNDVVGYDLAILTEFKTKNGEAKDFLLDCDGLHYSFSNLTERDSTVDILETIVRSIFNFSTRRRDVDIELY